MLEAPNVHTLGKKHSKHSTSSASSGNSPAGTQFRVPVIASATPGRTISHRDDMSTGLSSGHRATKIRRALAKFNLLSLTTNRYCIASVFSCCQPVCSYLPHYNTLMLLLIAYKLSL